MMKCQRAEELFGDYLDLTLPAPLLSDLEEHLESCAHCTPTLESYREVVQILRSSPHPQPSSDLADRILAATRPALAARKPQFVASPGFPLPQRINWAIWGAAAAFVLFLILRPPDALSGLGDRVNRMGHQTYSYGLRIYRQCERLIDELNVLRMTVGVAFEDRLDRLNERLKDLEEARRKNEPPPKDGSTLSPYLELTNLTSIYGERSLLAYSRSDT